MYDYTLDEYGKQCLELARECKTNVGFGALLVKNGAVLGKGRNRLATDEDRRMLTHVDYAIHSEQAAILDAIRAGYDVTGGTIYVLGLCLHGANKGALTVRTKHVFVCKKCPSAFMRYNISVNIPHVDGWSNLSPLQAKTIGFKLGNKGYWKTFCNKE